MAYTWNSDRPESGKKISLQFRTDIRNNLEALNTSLLGCSGNCVTVYTSTNYTVWGGHYATYNNGVNSFFYTSVYSSVKDGNYSAFWNGNNNDHDHDHDHDYGC